MVRAYAHARICMRAHVCERFAETLPTLPDAQISAHYPFRHPSGTLPAKLNPSGYSFTLLSEGFATSPAKGVGGGSSSGNDDAAEALFKVSHRVPDSSAIAVSNLPG